MSIKLECYKAFIFLVINLFANLSFSQINKIEYSIKTDIEKKLNKPLESFGVLYFNDKESLYKEYRGSDELNKNIKTKDTTSSIKFVKNNDTLILYKNFKSEKIVYSLESIDKKKYIEDILNLFDWKLTDETVKILNYECNVATTFFRGRNYKAYFYKNKKFSNGPIKFGGLPGVILKIEVTDSDCFFIMEATKVILNSNEKYNITNPFKDEKTITFDESKKKYQEKINALKSFYAQKGEEIIITNGGLEKLLDE